MALVWHAVRAGVGAAEGFRSSRWSVASLPEGPGGGALWIFQDVIFVVIYIFDHNFRNWIFMILIFRASKRFILRH